MTVPGAYRKVKRTLAFLLLYFQFEQPAENTFTLKGKVFNTAGHGISKGERLNFMAERKRKLFHSASFFFFFLDSLHAKVIRLPKSNGTNKNFRDFRFRPATANTLRQGLAEPFESSP